MVASYMRSHADSDVSCTRIISSIIIIYMQHLDLTLNIVDLHAHIINISIGS